jgi:anti-sigma regulatory factor (Ser/Thr protein kinase)
MEWLSLKGDLTRQNAVEQLLAPSTSDDPDSELCVHTASVRRLDVVTAAAIRMRMARHHREHTEGTVTLILPSQVELAARLFALLDPLPGRVTLTGQVDEQPPANYSLVPATIVSDSHAAVALGGATLDACERARISRRRSIFVTEAAMELADNALLHGQAPSDAPVVALTSVARGSQIELVVLDTGHGIAESEDPREALRAIPRRALDADPGFLSDILQRARAAGVQVQVQILAGTGRLLWTAMQHRTVLGRYLPGTTVIVRMAGERSVVRTSSAAQDE